MLSPDEPCGEVVLSADVGESTVAAFEEVGQFLVVDSHQPEHRGVEIVDVDLVVNGGETEVVGGAVNGAALDTPTGQP